MKEITEQETKDMIEQEKKELNQIIEQGGKITKTNIEEKDKITTEVILENPADNKSTGSRITISNNEITLQKL